MTHKSRAFILDARPYRETSSLLHVLCENEGALSLVARGLRSAKSKNAHAAQPFNLVQVTYALRPAASIGNLATMDLERSFQSLREDLSAYALANYWFEVLRAATEPRLAAGSLFTLTERFLTHLDQHGGAISTAHARYFLLLLQELGFALQIDTCFACGSRQKLSHFDPVNASTICATCASNTPRPLPWPEIIFANAQTTLTAAQAAGFMFVINTMLTQTLEHQFRTFTFLGEIALPGYFQ